MIYGIEGRPGSGKTLYGVEILMRQPRERRFANFHSVNNEWTFVLWEDIQQLSDAVVIIDEAHMWFSSRNWQGQSVGDLAAFQQHRKFGIDLYWIVQHRNRIDSAIREVTTEILTVRRYGPLVRIVATDPVETGTKKRPHWQKVGRLRRDLFNKYYTEEYVGQRDGKGYGFGAPRQIRTLSSTLPEHPPANWVTIETAGNVEWLPIGQFYGNRYVHSDATIRYWLVRGGRIQEVVHHQSATYIETAPPPRRK